jgi:acetyl esterase
VRDLALVAIAGVAYEAPLGARRGLLFATGLVVPPLAVLLFGDVSWYCGLSGLSHALLAAALSYEVVCRRGAARAIVVTAGYDPLVDEGDRYAELLARAGTEVRHRRHPSLIHGFLSLAGGVVAARAALDELCGDIRELLGAR